MAPSFDTRSPSAPRRSHAAVDPAHRSARVVPAEPLEADEADLGALPAPLAWTIVAVGVFALGYAVATSMWSALPAVLTVLALPLYLLATDARRARAEASRAAMRAAARRAHPTSLPARAGLPGRAPVLRVVDGPAADHRSRARRGPDGGPSMAA